MNNEYKEDDAPDDSNQEDVFKGYGIEISLGEPEDFLKIRETLTRMGISSKKEGRRVLRQSCHILHTRGRYAIVHFKELYALDEKETEISDEDLGRRNTITGLLAEWGLCTILDELTEEDPKVTTNQIAIIRHDDKKNWELTPMYRMRSKRKNK
jgi:Bacteriophage translational regulator